jgi:hypothetical protein
LLYAGEGQTKYNTMNKEYIVVWVMKNNDLSYTDDWEAFQSYEEAKLLYDEMLRDDNLYTATLAETLESTES